MDLVKLLEEFWRNFQSGQFQELGYWNYILLALLVTIEGPIVTMLGAAAAAAGFMRPFFVFVSAAIGNLIADLGWYYLGYVGRIGWLLRYGRWLGIRRRHIRRLMRGMHNHSRKILLVAKLSTGFVIPTLIAAGLVKVPWRRWFPVVFAAEMVWTGSLVLIGYYATQAIKQIELGLHYVAILGFVVVPILLIWLTRRKLRPTDTVSDSNGDEDDDDEEWLR